MNAFGNKIDSLLSYDRICNLIKYSQHCRGLGGYLAEFGVYQGGSLEIMARFNPGVDIIGVDSFEGVPAASNIDIHQEGDFGGVNARNVIGYFGLAYPAVRIFKGFIPKIFEAFDGNTRFGFSHIDLDMYDSIYNTLDFVLPRTLKGGMILLDDYKVRSTPGCEAAVNYFFKSHKADISYRGEVKMWESDDAKTNNQYLIVV